MDEKQYIEGLRESLGGFKNQIMIKKTIKKIIKQDKKTNSH